MTSEESEFLPKNMAAFPCTEHETMRPDGQKQSLEGRGGMRAHFQRKKKYINAHF